MRNTKFHEGELSDKKFLVTGGAGFVGSNIAEYLCKNQAAKVVVLDSLVTGLQSNIDRLSQYPNFEFIKGDIRDYDTCVKAMEGIDYVSHQAALGSVPRSIKDPITSNESNISGFLNILTAAKNNGNIKKLVYAASSSTYGDSKELPKVEGGEGNPLSPYAVTKLVNEIYGDVFSKVYGFHALGLRYFNIFGPYQSPDNPYAAVIPIFMKCALQDKQPTINGDGETSRDFTFVENAIQANVKGMLNTTGLEQHEVVNIAFGDRTTLNQLWDAINDALGKNIKPIYGPERPGDVKHSLANISKARKLMGYNPEVGIKEGLKSTVDWFKKGYEG